MQPNHCGHYTFFKRFQNKEGLKQTMKHISALQFITAYITCTFVIIQGMHSPPLTNSKISCNTIIREISWKGILLILNKPHFTTYLTSFYEETKCFANEMCCYDGTKRVNKIILCHHRSGSLPDTWSTQFHLVKSTHIITFLLVLLIKNHSYTFLLLTSCCSWYFDEQTQYMPNPMRTC